MNSVSIKEVLYKEKNIIDIRPNYEYQYGTIPGAINIPLIKLINNPQKYLNKEETYYLLCASGRQSSNLVNMLNIQGYHTVNIIGGYNNYLLTK